MAHSKIKSVFIYLLIIGLCSIGLCGEIISPIKGSTEIAKAGESFDVWFNSDGATVNSVELHAEYHSVTASMSVSTGSWDNGGEDYDTVITVTVPAGAPADRYDIVLKTTGGDQVSVSGVKVVTEWKTDYRVVHTSDTHVQWSDAIPDRLNQVIFIANIMDAELIFHTGDVSEHKENQSVADIILDGDSIGHTGHLAFRDATAASFVVQGNHDTTRTWQRYFGAEAPNVKYGNSRWCFLNNGDSFESWQQTKHNAWLAGAGAGGNFRAVLAHHGNYGAWGYNNFDYQFRGHNHSLGAINPHDPGDGNLDLYFATALYLGNYRMHWYTISNNTGTLTAGGAINTDSGSAGFGLPTGWYDVLENNEERNNNGDYLNDPDDTVWIPNLDLNYANANDGTFATNTATIDNYWDEALPGCHVRFVMPLGETYNVSQGIITQAFDGDSFHIVDVSVDISASSTTVITITEGSPVPDYDPPTPDPMTWAVVPAATGSSTIAMTATAATDISGVQYYFTCIAGGGNNSGWQGSTLYTDTELTAETTYTYTAKARDLSTNQNETGVSSAEQATTTSAVGGDSNWNNSGGDRAWDNASNWSAGVPIILDKAGIRATGIDGPIIDTGTAAVANVVVLGDWTSVGDTLDITGGSLTTGGWFIMAYMAANDATFNVSGGTTTVGSHLDVGRAGAGTMNMTAGTVTVTDAFGIATIGGTGEVYLDGGTISAGSITMTSGGLLDITDGTLIVNGDATSTINGYIGSGWITGYGGSGTLDVDYNVSNPGQTTVTASADSYCGDETCDPGEDQCNCSDDCGTPPATETNCTDGINEDCDSDTDCDDADCDGDPACPSCGAKGDPCTSDDDCCKTCNMGPGRCK